MAIIKQGILGGIQNKIGNVVGSSWKGIAVLKSLPVSVANPRTAPQVAQRDKFSQCVAFASSILAEVIKPLWDRFAQRQSGYNAWVQRNIDFFNSTQLITPNSLVISSGKMTATPIATAVGNEGTGNLTVTWLNDSGQGFKQASDTLYLVQYNSTTNKAIGNDTGIVRSAGTAIVPVLGEQADSVWVYIAFRRADGTIVSDTSVRNITVS